MGSTLVFLRHVFLGNLVSCFAGHGPAQGKNVGWPHFELHLLGPGACNYVCDAVRNYPCPRLRLRGQRFYGMYAFTIVRRLLPLFIAWGLPLGPHHLWNQQNPW